MLNYWTNQAEEKGPLESGQMKGYLFFCLCFLALKKYLFIWLHWVSVAAHRLSVVPCRLLWLWHMGSRVHELSSCSTWASLPHGTWDLISPTRVQAFLDHQQSPLPSTLQWMLFIRQYSNNVSWPWLPHSIRTSSLLFTVFNTIHLTHVKCWQVYEQQQSW